MNSDDMRDYQATESKFQEILDLFQKSNLIYQNDDIHSYCIDNTYFDRYQTWILEKIASKIINLGAE